MIARRINAKVYLEGVRIPFYKMTLSMAPNRMNLLHLEIAPVRELFEILPRTYVQAFYDDGSGFKVFFEGEVIGHGFTKAQGSRHMVLTCADMSNYWEYSYSSYLSRSSLEQYAIINEMRVFTGVSPSQAGDKKEAERVFVVRGIGNDVVAKLRQEDVVTGIKDAFNLVEKVNPFFRDHFAKFKIKERFKVLPDGQIKNFTTLTGEDRLNFTFGNAEAYAPLLGVFSTILQQVYQNFWSLSLPGTIVGGVPVNFTIVPATFLTAPPRCNVLFPDTHDGFSYSRSFLQEPTRYKVFTGGSSDDFLGSQFWYAPKEFRESVIPAIRKAQAQNKDVRDENLLVESDDPELDERIRGIIPDQMSLQQDNIFALRRTIIAQAKNQQAGEEDVRKRIDQLMAQITDFWFLVRKFSSRAASVQMPFNPNIHPAFPVLILDAEARIFGSPLELVHTIDADGNAQTMVSCGFSRHKDVGSDVIETSLPWFNRSFDPKGIGKATFQFTDVDGKQKGVDGAYPALVDPAMGSILSSSLPVFTNGVQTSDKVPESQEEAANLLFDLYLNSGDRGVFIDEYTKRRVQTFAEHLAFLGLTEENEDILTGPVYDSAKRQVIEDAKAKLIESGLAISETTFTREQS